VSMMTGSQANMAGYPWIRWMHGRDADWVRRMHGRDARVNAVLEADDCHD
jgi:hypothetical protein